MKEMVEGYLDGLKDYRQNLPEDNNRGAAYKHGWYNGRDDRNGKPRDRADVLRKRADMIIRTNGGK